MFRILLGILILGVTFYFTLPDDLTICPNSEVQFFVKDDVTIGETFLAKNTLLEVIFILKVGNLKLDYRNDEMLVLTGKVDGQPVQLARTKNGVLIGVPFLLGSY
ncbi:MAG: hypothetical protein FWD89_03620 [Firmicutes bacterium]|nr:hypothetical protein [Bacillota bacterium]MCL2771376.1 hypothetical protein [Bacillota bacterium]